MVKVGRDRHLQEQARRLGFADLRGCLQALLDQGWSVPQLAAHLATTRAAIRAAIADHHLQQPSRRERLARQRHRAGQQRVAARAAARAAELGFAGVWAYLADRVVTQAWTLAEVGAELGATPSTLRRLLDQHQVRRRRRPGGNAPPPTRPAGRSSRRGRPSGARHT